MTTSPDPMDTVSHTLLREFHAIDERATLARRLHQLMGQCMPIEIPVQYERLYLLSLAGRGELTNDYPRSRRHRRRRRVPPARSDGVATVYTGANREYSAWTRTDNHSSFMVPVQESFLDPAFWRAWGAPRLGGGL